MSTSVTEASSSGGTVDGAMRMLLHVQRRRQEIAADTERMIALLREHEQQLTDPYIEAEEKLKAELSQALDIKETL